MHMGQILSKIISRQHCMLVLLVSFLFIFSCKKDINNQSDDPNNITPDFVTKVTASSVSGFVTDQNDNAVINATVKIGSQTTSTDFFGFFEIKNVEVVKTAATVTVSYTGYFNAIKTFMASEGKGAFFRIKLLPKIIAGTFTGTAGGVVTMSNGMAISFPSNAIKNAVTGAAYVGLVNVAAQWIDPTSAELHQIMPGDLRGIDADGFMKGLTTYGMAAVELTGSAGELLQVADSKKAMMTMPVPASIIATAPSSIPLWYFDESKGVWKEEGIATKTGNNYVGEVSHFSFWNCDMPGSYVQFDCTIKYENGTPASNVLVKLTVSSTNIAGYGYTDSSGYVSGLVPDNSQLQLQVLPVQSCSAVYTQNFSTQNSNVSMGIINLGSIGSQFATQVSGTVVDCNNNPVAYAYVNLVVNNQSYTISSSILGVFDFNVLLCSSSQAGHLQVYSYSPIQGITDTTFTIATGANALGEIIIPCAPSVSYNCISTGYLYHPSSPRAIAENKTMYVLSANTYQVDFGDLGASGYVAIFYLDVLTNKLTITAAPGSAGAPFTQFDNELPTANPGYTPQWPGSIQCNNSYDPVLREYRVRYGYLGTSGWRIVEEILAVQ